MPSPRPGARPDRPRSLPVLLMTLLGLGGCAYDGDGSAYGYYGPAVVPAYGPAAYGYGPPRHGGALIGGPFAAAGGWRRGYPAGGGYPAWDGRGVPAPPPVFQGGHRGGWPRPAPSPFAWGPPAGPSPSAWHDRRLRAPEPGAWRGVLAPRDPAPPAGPGGFGRPWHGGGPPGAPPLAGSGRGGGPWQGAGPPARPGGGPPPWHRGGWRPDR